MIIQCDACQTRFRLPNEKLKPGGVKVRCTKCGQVFRVDAPAVEPSSIKAAPEPPGVVAGSATPSSPSAPEHEQKAAETGETADNFDFDEFNMESVDQGESATGEQPVQFDLDGELPDLDLPDDLSFDEPSLDTAAVAAKQTVEEGAEDLLADFSPDDLLEENERLDTLTGNLEGGSDRDTDADNGYWDAAAIEPGEPNIGGDLGETYEMNGGAESGQDLPELDFPDPSEIDADLFDEPKQTEGIDDSPGLELDTGAPSGDGRVTEDFVFEEAPEDLDEPPPLPDLPEEREHWSATAAISASRAEEASKTSPPPSRPRRRASPPTRKRKKKKSRALLLFFLLLLTIAGTYYWLAQRQGTWDPVILANYLRSLTENKSGVDPTVNIELSNLKGMFVTNQSAGQLFAITGYATNRYQHPRSTVTVRGVIYDRKGQAVLQQTVFCGNPLDEAALRTLPWSKIEESMNNQFGEALSNLDIAPGKAVPFTIVFKNLPSEVAEFNVVVVDSRPGSQ